MNDYLLTGDLANEHRKELQRLREETRLIAKAERTRLPKSRVPSFARIGYLLLRGLLANSLGTAGTADRLGDGQ